MAEDSAQHSEFLGLNHSETRPVKPCARPWCCDTCAFASALQRHAILMPRTLCQIIASNCFYWIFTISPLHRNTFS